MTQPLSQCMPLATIAQLRFSGLPNYFSMVEYCLSKVTLLSCVILHCTCWMYFTPFELRESPAQPCATWLREDSNQIYGFGAIPDYAIHSFSYFGSVIKVSYCIIKNYWKRYLDVRDLVVMILLYIDNVVV